jgi:UDP:flavonoid glycosyltransferase YjiC (YdhE family)
VLFFSEAVTLAHMARPAVLAAALETEQFEAVLAANPRYQALFPDLAVRTVAIDSIEPTAFMDALDRGKPVYDAATLKRYVEQDLAVIDAEAPQVIVGDFRLSLSISARLRGIPYLAITNAYWSPYARQRYPIPAHPLVGLVGLNVAQALFTAVRPAVFALHARPLNRVRRRFGLPSLGGDLRAVYTDADQVLYADLPGLVPMAPLPDHHRYTGPVAWSPADARPDWWDRVNRDRPVIYLTPGSSGRADQLSEWLTALSALEAEVIVASAGAEVSCAADNVYIADFLPGREACELASLVICNGGSPTSYQALAAGTPVLGVCRNLDQHLNMASLQRAGVGVSLRSDKVTAPVLAARAKRLLADERSREAALSFRSRLENRDHTLSLGEAIVGY